ncbi:MAG: hypothetical protein JXB05_00275 [Myxococcaceae bacterium]|nr:hypothetical protein [Myxococcaceae bacterium]
MRRLVATAVMSLALLGLAGCKGSCRELSEKLCDCFTNSLDREFCLRRAANDEALVDPASEDEARCEELLTNEQCTCEAIETNEGKVACGLAR